RMQRARILLDQRPRRGVALGDPRALVEKARDLGERLEVELDDAPAERFHCGDAARKGRLRVRVAEERELSWARNAEPQSLRRARQRRRLKGPRIGVARVECAGRAEDGEGVGDVEG